MSKRTFYRASYLGVVIVLGVLLATTLAGVRAAQNNGGAVRVGNADIGGVVTSSKGPEAGVWVIAETTDLPTKLVKIVVTDDQGRYRNSAQNRRLYQAPRKYPELTPGHN